MFEVLVQYWWQYLLLAICCYLPSNINYAVIFSRLIKKSDVRRHGSGNAGATNMFRVFGLRMGVLTFICDALKGVACCLLAKLIFSAFANDLAVTTAGYVGALFAVLGHVFPCFYNFRGGKGVATSIGAMFALQPLLALCCVLPCCVVLLISDRVSIVSLLLSLFVIIWSWAALAVNVPSPVIYRNIDAFCCLLMTLTFATVIFAHRHNIVRIFTGKEQRTGIRKALRGKSDDTVE